MNNLDQLKDKTITNILQITSYSQNSHLRSIIEDELDKLLIELNFKPNKSLNTDNTLIDFHSIDDLNKEPWRYLTHYTSGVFNAYMKLGNLWFYYDFKEKQWRKSSIASVYLERTLRTVDIKEINSYKRYFK